VFERTDEFWRDRDNLKWSTTDADVLPAWVADMDVEVPPVVVRELRRRLDGADLGYPDFDAPDPLVVAFEERMATRFGWTPAPDRGRLFTDVIQAFCVLVDLLTEPGDGVALHVPAYPIFLTSIAETGRRVVPVPFSTGPFGASSDDLARTWRDEAVRLVVVVNPHNPLGRMLGADELRPIADAAAALDLTVLADEIHADLAFDGRRHVPFASLGPEVEARTVTVTSASKAFNLAGLHCAVAHLGDERVRSALAALPFAHLGGVGTLSRAASVAAWTEGDDWLDELAEATYLAWLDFAGTRIEADPAAALLAAGVRLSPGPEFTAHTGLDSSTFARLNFGTSPERLGRILDRISAALGRGHPQRAK